MSRHCHCSNPHRPLQTMEDLRGETELRERLFEAWLNVQLAESAEDRWEAARWANELEFLAWQVEELEMSGEVGFCCNCAARTAGRVHREGGEQ
jgi:hypothetical protein